MKIKVIIIFILILCVYFLAGDSLWSPDFNGFLLSSNRYNLGDVIIVDIDVNSAISFTSSSKDDKSITLEFSGGEYGNLLSFLPIIKAKGDFSSNGGDEYQIESQVVAKVTNVDNNGNIFVQGNKIVQIQGKEESVTISGWIDPDDLDQERRIPFAKIADARLTYQGLLQPSTALINDSDIQTLIEEITASEATVDLGEGTAATQTTRTVQLTDEKRRELILLYINRLVDIIFQ